MRINQPSEKKVIDNDSNIELNLCELLGIDVEGIAVKLAMESDMKGDASSEEHNKNLESNSKRLSLLLE